MQRFAELAELLPEPPPVIAVTIPTQQSEDAVRRALHAARDRGAPCLGVIENMAGGPFAGDAADALAGEFGIPVLARVPFHPTDDVWDALVPDRKSTRLNSSHDQISYAVFCLKKKKKEKGCGLF